MGDKGNGHTDASKLKRSAILIGIIGIFLCVGIGIISHNSSKGIHIRQSFETSLQVVKTISSYIDSYPVDERQDCVLEINTLWSNTQKHYENSYISVVDEHGRTLLNTKYEFDHKEYNEVVNNLVETNKYFPGINTLLEGEADWAGVIEDQSGREQLTAYTYNKKIHGLIAMHIDLNELKAEINQSLLPWTLGLSLVSILLLPLSLILMYQAYSKKKKEASDSSMQLNYSKQSLEMALTSSNMILWDWYPDERQIYLNTLWSDFLGFSKDINTVNIDFWKKLMDKDGFDIFEKSIEQHLYEESDFFICEFRMMGLMNELKWVQCRGKIIEKDNNNNSLRISGTLLDITQQKESKLELKRINKELETFIYKSTHNLKGPVASIRGLVTLTKNTTVNKESEEYLGLLEKSSQKLEKNLDGLMDLAKVKQNKLTVRKVNMEKIISNEIESLKFQPGFDQIRLKIKMEQKNTFYNDEALIKSVFHNLIENAYKYRRKNADSYINILGFVDKQHARIKIMDNGIGIPENMVGSIFDMFSRATNEVKGTGLGLYIVKNAVTRLGGEISVRSQISKGCIFTLTIPNLKCKYSHEQVPILEQS